MLLVLPSDSPNVSKDNNINPNPIIPSSNNENTENKVHYRQRTRFTKEEDDLLKDIVEKRNDKFDWNQIASLMPGRTARQCRDRYSNYLRPQLTNGAWTQEEDQLLEQMFEKYGPQWAKIAAHFPNRSDVNIKNHHTCIVKRLNRQQKEKDKPTNVETNNVPDNHQLTEKESNNSNSLSIDTNNILSPIRLIEINNNNNTNESNNNQNIFNTTVPTITETRRFNPTISDPVIFSRIESSSETDISNNLDNESLIQDIINLARFQQIPINENLVNRNLPITPNIKNELLKNTFSLLVNLSCLISQNDS